MYLDDLAAAIHKHIPGDRIPDGDMGDLLRRYAVLLRAKGRDVNQSDIHDAWSAWMVNRDQHHEALVPYDALEEEVRKEDRVFADAVRRAADEVGATEPSRPVFLEVLFPSGPPSSDEEKKQAIDLYKVMVQSSESLVSRRQGVNTFFLTINGALLTASGLVIKSLGSDTLTAWSISVLALAGAILCLAWRSLILSFGQLNRGKFQVINTIERYLRTAIYAAEWEALDRGENQKVYRSFTSREIWVPIALLLLYFLTIVVSALVGLGCIALP